MTKHDTIQEMVEQLRAHDYKVTVFSGRTRMPAALKGLPDLYLMKDGAGYWVEVKLRHANYMRDQMRDVQWRWYHTRRKDFGPNLRYAIVDSGFELLAWLETNVSVRIPDYHWKRYIEWKETNDR